MRRAVVADDETELVTDLFTRGVRRRPARSDDPTTIFDVPMQYARGSQAMLPIRRAPTEAELEQSYEAAMAVF